MKNPLFIFVLGAFLSLGIAKAEEPENPAFEKRADIASVLKDLKEKSGRSESKSKPSPEDKLLDGFAAVERHDYKKAIDILTPLAKQGEPNSQVVLGKLYEDGFGADKDYATAENLYRLSATQGNVEAQYLLGEFHFFGVGGKKDVNEAIKWLRMAADKEQALAQYRLGEIYERGSGVPKNASEAVRWYTSSAENHNVDAQYI